MRINFFGDYFFNSYFTVSDEINNILLNSERNILNLEAPIVISEEASAINKVGAALKHNSKCIDMFKKYNITDVCLANNHYYDFGTFVAKEGIDILKKNNIEYHGVVYGDYLLINEINNVAIINVAESEFGLKADNMEVGFLSVTDPYLFVLISELKIKKKKIIIIAHAGFENLLTPLKTWKKYYRSFIDSGVSMVVCHHPHVPQHHELYKGKYIFYSLGNFIFDKKSDNKWNSISKVVMLDIDDDLFKVDYFYSKFDNGVLTKVNEADSILLDNELNFQFNANLDLSFAYNHRCMMDLKRLFLYYFPFLGRVLTCDKWKMHNFHIHNLRFESHRFAQLEYLESKKNRA